MVRSFHALTTVENSKTRQEQIEMELLMNYLSHVPEDAEMVPSPTGSIPTEKRPTGFLSLWYRMTSPPQPAETASFQERELFRRGRTGSQISIVLFILIFISFPAAFAGSNSLLIMILAASLIVLSLALALNRMRQVNLAGILVVISILTGPTVNIITTPGGISTSALPIFSLLVLPLMCAVSFLPPISVFAVVAINALFTLFALTSLPSSGELHHVLQTAFPGIVTPILLGQFIVSIVAYIWVRGARLAILRADRAEQIAALEQREIERQQMEIEQKQQLDVGIQQIIETHVQVANGNFAARAPLVKENILWQVAYSLNNLLARLQSYRMLDVQQRRNQEALNYLVHAIQRTKREGGPLQVKRTGTPVDALIIELASLRLGELPAQPGISSSSFPRNARDPR